MTRTWCCIRPLVVIALLQSCGNANSPGSVRLPDQTFYTSGAYSAFASPWSSYLDKSLQRERDFLDSIVVQPATFPDGTLIEWKWPFRRPKVAGVWGYLAVSYGNYDGGLPQVTVEPKQVKDIDSLSEDISWSASGFTSYNLLNEFYLTRDAGKSDQKVIEIGLLLHPESRRNPFIEGARLVGRYADREGRSWQVVLNGTFCMFIPDHDVSDGQIDLKAMLDFLVDKTVITGSEWFNGLAIGVEPVWGQGSTTIAIWKVHYSYK